MTKAELIASFMREYDRCVAGNPPVPMTAREYFEATLDVLITEPQTLPFQPCEFVQGDFDLSAREFVCRTCGEAESKHTGRRYKDGPTGNAWHPLSMHLRP